VHVNKISNKIGNQVSYILRSKVVFPMYHTVTTPLHLPLGFTGSFENRTRNAKRAPMRSRASTRYISVPP